MDITWLGHACFRLRGKEGTVITDPFAKTTGLSLPRMQADVITVSHTHPGHSNTTAIGGGPYIVSGPGEYEVQNIFITGISAYHDAEQGKQRGKVTVYLIELEDLIVCHLGDLGHVLSETQVEAMGRIDVLLAPVGGGNSLDATQAAEVIGLLEPRIVIPMHYHTSSSTGQIDPLTRFIKEMGARSDPQRNLLHPALRLEEVEPNQPWLDVTRSGEVAAAPEPPISWTLRSKKS